MSKADPRVSAYGDVDELNAFLGWAATLIPEDGLADELRAIQRDLFTIGADLATPTDAGEKTERKTTRLAEARVSELEGAIDRLTAETEPLTHFILPGGHPAAAALQICRAVCRRAERSVVALGEDAEVNAATIVYLNRLSDLLFTMARWVNAKEGIEEPVWKGHEEE